MSVSSSNIVFCNYVLLSEHAEHCLTSLLLSLWRKEPRSRWDDCNQFIIVWRIMGATWAELGQTGLFAAEMHRRVQLVLRGSIRGCTALRNSKPGHAVLCRKEKKKGAPQWWIPERMLMMTVIRITKKETSASLAFVQSSPRPMNYL